MNLTLLLLIVASLILNIVIFVVFKLKLKKTQKLLDEVSDTTIEYETTLLKALAVEHGILDEDFRKKFNEFSEAVLSNLEAVKNEKQNLAIEDAILILQKQDNNWFDEHFFASRPTTALIEDVFNAKFQPNEERHARFIEDVRKESEL